MPVDPHEHPGLAPTQRMHAAAEQGDWTEVARLNAEREPLLAAGFDSSHVLQLREMIRLEAEIVALASAARELAGQRVVAFKRGRRAMGVYNQGNQAR